MVSIEDAVIARFESHGERFEILVDPDLALEFRKTPEKYDIEDIIAVEEIFKDAKKGEKASEKRWKKCLVQLIL